MGQWHGGTEKPEDYLHILPSATVPPPPPFTNISSGSHLDRRGFRDLPQNDNTALVIWTHFLSLLVHLDHRRSWKQSGQTSLTSHRRVRWNTFYATPSPNVCYIAHRLTSQDVQDEIHVRGECLYALHAGYGPNGNKLVAVHLGHQVQVLREVFPKRTME